MKWWLGGFVALFCQAQQELPPDLALLAKLKVKLAQDLKQLPNYTCSETVERWVKRSNASKPALLDTLHLEIAYVDGRELFALAGAAKIEQSEIKKLVRGTIGGGSFATIVNEIIQGQGATFHYEGNSELEGQPSALYTFHVARLVSGYRITTPSASAMLGYSGRFWADANSLDLKRLELTADDIPPQLQLSAVSESIEYRRIPIGNSTFLLPQVSEMSLTSAGGDQAMNHTSYQACRQFAVDSVLSFAEIPAEPAPKPTTPTPRTPGTAAPNLPDEFTVDINLETPIDSESSAVGATISASLRQNVKIEKTTVVPKGAMLSGQITRIDNQRGNYTIDLTFSSLDF